MYPSDIGIYSEATSDGFVVDNTPPTMTKQVSHDSRRGTLKQNSQVLPTSLQAK